MTRYANLLDASQSSYYNAKISEAGRDAKVINGLMNEIMHRNKRIKLPSHSSAKTLADNFGTFFDDKITKIQLALPVGIQLPVFTMPSCVSCLDTLNPVTEEETTEDHIKKPFQVLFTGSYSNMDG